MCSFSSYTVTSLCGWTPHIPLSFFSESGWHYVLPLAFHVFYRSIDYMLWANSDIKCPEVQQIQGFEYWCRVVGKLQVTHLRGKGAVSETCWKCASGTVKMKPVFIPFVKRSLSMKHRMLHRYVTWKGVLSSTFQCAVKSESREYLRENSIPPLLIWNQGSESECVNSSR